MYGKNVFNNLYVYVTVGKIKKKIENKEEILQNKQTSKKIMNPHKVERRLNKLKYI